MHKHSQELPEAATIASHNTSSVMERGTKSLAEMGKTLFCPLIFAPFYKL